MIMSGCPMKRSLAYPEHSQALCSNQPVAHWSAWKYVNHQSTWNIDFLLSLRVNSLTFYISGGSCWLGSCIPLGFRLEKTGVCATLHLAWTLNLDLDFATLHLAWTLHLYLDFAMLLYVTRCPLPLPSSSNLAISTSSNHNTWSWY